MRKDGKKTSDGFLDTDDETLSEKGAFSGERVQAEVSSKIPLKLAEAEQYQDFQLNNSFSNDCVSESE